MNEQKIKVAVLMGGPSAEHEVSLSTGKMIINALDKEKYDIQPITITKDRKWRIPTSEPILLKRDAVSIEKSLISYETGKSIEILKNDKKIDVVFIAMHGTFGEDGVIQGFLDLIGIPYTGSGILASALAMDKLKSAELYSFHGMTVPKYIHLTRKEWVSKKMEIIESIIQKFGFPVVIKPRDCGSIVGITIVKRETDLEKAIIHSLELSNNVLAQEYILGTEVTCAILDEGGDKEPVALPPTQIIPKNAEFFDYNAKYTPGATEEVTPPRLHPAIIKNIQDIALKVHKILGCSGMSRTDMIVRNKELYVLETNTIPGMSETSLLPQATAAGITFPKLIDKIIQAALNKPRNLC